MESIIIKFLSGHQRNIEYDPEEFLWQFIFRVGIQLNKLIHDGQTLNLRLLYNRESISGQDKKFSRMKEIISDSSIAIHALEFYNNLYLDIGNACPKNTDREICSICLEILKPFTSGSRNNPEIPLILKCFHVFHQRCIFESVERNPNCPLCRCTAERL